MFRSYGVTGSVSGSVIGTSLNTPTQLRRLFWCLTTLFGICDTVAVSENVRIHTVFGPLTLPIKNRLFVSCRVSSSHLIADSSYSRLEQDKF